MKHKFAIIGLGIMGRRMLENVMRHPKFEVSGLWDPSPDAIAKTRLMTAIATNAPNIPIAQSAQEAMQEADVVYLACPPAPRKTYALEAAATWRNL
ncbi:MAG: Inositol 2-dehydrogenase/D-chiro-inositol 3-dehydrogenase [Pseudomonadota bacterium]